MRAKKPRLTGLLLQRREVAGAPARGLRAALALPPDQSDYFAHLRQQLLARFVELDKLFGLASDSADIWQQRAKALVEHEFGIPSKAAATDWWSLLAYQLALQFAPGFSLRPIGKKKHGAPPKWTNERLAQLFADVEFLHKKTGMKVRRICVSLPQREGYRKRWGHYSGDNLRKAYARAKKRRQDPMFELELCGTDAMIRTNGMNGIEAAIKRHALRV